jgi:peptidyl-prolyl cis-trans isomerase C
MLKTGKFAALAILSALAVNPAFAEDKSAALVNGVSIPQTRVDMIVTNAVAQGQVDSPDLRKNIRENLIIREIVLQEAKAKGMDKLPDVQEQMEVARQEILMNSFLQDYAKNHPISEDQLKQEYDKLKVNLGNKEYKARHILVDTEDEAKTIIAQLGKKGKFDKIAKEKSKDSGSAAHGGELDWSAPSNFVPPFANALLSLKKGTYTKEPVKSQFGWHIIKLDDVRVLKVPSYEELKPQIQQRLQQQSVQDYIADLRSKAKIE